MLPTIPVAEVLVLNDVFGKGDLDEMDVRIEVRDEDPETVIAASVTIAGNRHQFGERCVGTLNWASNVK